MGKKKFGFEASARRSILGDKIELESIEGHWFRPRRYSVPGEEAIEATKKQVKSSLFSKSTIKKLAPLYRNKDITQINQDEFMNLLDEDEFAEVVETFMNSEKANTETIKNTLFYGIGEHNFTDDEEGTFDVPWELVEAIIEYPNIADEMVVAIKDHNRPLANTTSGTSEKSQNGSTTTQTSEKNAKTSQTEETPSS